VLKVWDDGLPASLDVLGDLDLPVAVPEATAVIGTLERRRVPVHLRPTGHRRADAPALARSMRRMHDHPLVELPRLPIEESWSIEALRDRLDRPVDP
jgi:hypothetical protein